MHRIGNALGVILPKPLRDSLGCHVGDYFAIVRFGDTLVMTRIIRSQVLDRDEIPATALQGVDTGRPDGA